MRLIFMGFVVALAVGLAAEPTTQIQVEYVAAEFGGAVVKGAPYSGEAVTETTQTLADGNRIVRKNTASVYRDSQGRTRREQTLGAIGMLAVQSNEPLKIVTISDPVAGVSYSLDPRTQTATRIPFGGAVSHAGLPAAGMMKHETEDVFFQVTSPPPAGGGELKRTIQATVIQHTGDRTLGRVDALGKQVMEGVEVEGTRETTTIAAGQIGNERPIEVVSERWYSPRLQTVVMSRRTDPQMGETVYRLTNVNLSEPSAALFQVPAGYTVKESADNQWFERKD